MVHELYALGYENAAIEDFIATLKAAYAECLIDVRECPFSRRKGFSKNILQASLQANGIEYVHLKGLGDPKEGRDAARAGNREEFVRIFTEHMKTSEAIADLKIAIGLTTSRVSCLLCYERDPSECHRTIVARAIAADTDQPVRSIGVHKNYIASTRSKGRLA